MNAVEPLPPTWCETVISILAKGSSPDIRWSLRAQTDWQQFGSTWQAHQLIIRTLSHPGIWGEKVSGMIPLPGAPAGAGAQDIRGFLCAHPLGGLKPLYTKVGLFENKVTLDLFSLHIDLTGDLAKRIATAQKNRK